MMKDNHMKLELQVRDPVRVEVRKTGKKKFPYDVVLREVEEEESFQDPFGFDCTLDQLEVLGKAILAYVKVQNENN